MPLRFLGSLWGLRTNGTLTIERMTMNVRDMPEMTEQEYQELQAGREQYEFERMMDEVMKLATQGK